MPFIHYTLSFILCLFLAACGQKPAVSTKVSEQGKHEAAVQFSGDSAHAFVVKQCDFGPRTPGSEAHKLCGDWITAKFKSYGLQVTEQTAPITAWDGKTFTCRNIIAAHQPELAERIIICAHWDSRPWADCEKDKAKRLQAILGANDGASGVGVMLELARQIKAISPKVGVDFICFDLEDYGCPEWEEAVSQTEDDWCLGSAYWAAHPHKEAYSAHYGILLDMVGDPKARFCYEGFSMHYAPEVVAKVWATAKAVGAGDFFKAADGSFVTDDHLPLNRIAGIPTINIIDFQAQGDHSFAATWHTLADTPENVSPHTLRAVGQTLVSVLQSPL